MHQSISGASRSVISTNANHCILHRLNILGDQSKTSSYPPFHPHTVDGRNPPPPGMYKTL